MTDEQHDAANLEPLARYWVKRSDVRAKLENRWDRGWLFGWRDVTKAEQMRTFIPTVFPVTGVGHVFPIAFPTNPSKACLLHAAWSSLVFDYVARQKVSGLHMTYSVLEQLACPMPAEFGRPVRWQTNTTFADWIHPYILELSYTSWRLKPYAEDLGDDGPPFRWDPGRRALLRADLDAAFLHVYGLNRHEAEHVLDSFFVVRKYDERDLGEYRTKRLVLEAYDRMAAAIEHHGRGWLPLADAPAGHGPRHHRRQQHRPR